jgi:hypothetical protein
MENNLHRQEIIFGSSDSSTSQKISRLEKQGKIRKLANRIYSGNLRDNPEVIIKKNIFNIIGVLYPNAIVSHRSAIELKPTEIDKIFVTHKYTKETKLPGLIIQFIKGKGPIAGDHKFANTYYSNRERAILENLQISRKKGPESKTLPIELIEEKLNQIIIINGEDALNEVRDKCRHISEELDMPNEFVKLDKIIGALLTTKDSAVLKSKTGIARANGLPHDSERVDLFEKLFIELNQKEFKIFENQNTKPNSYNDFAFFESYFSNYIEGTEFELDDAKKIIDTQTPMPAREEDSHDVLGTYNIVSNYKEMSITPESPEQLIDLLKYRHKILLSARTSKKPGEFKDKNNKAGNTHFVDKELVRGTLTKGFEIYKGLQNPMSKAIFMMFMISEVHPFLDGNGRTARVMMNAELSKNNQSKIIIPNVYRDDYLGALRKLSRQKEPSDYIRMLERAHLFSSTIYGNNFEEFMYKLERSNAFKEHTEGKLEIQF